MSDSLLNMDQEIAENLNALTLNKEEKIFTDTNIMLTSESGKPFEEFSNTELRNQRMRELEQMYNVNNHKIIRKIDLCLLPACCLLFFISWFNKNIFGYFILNGVPNIEVGVVRIGCTYTAFFIPYMVLQMFSNFFLKYIRPHFWISITVILYGVVAIGSAYAKNYGVFVFCACIHGLLQAGTETGTYYILAHFYAKPESQKRFSLIYAMSSISGIALALINFGISFRMKNRRGLEIWQWLSIIEGAITILGGFILFFTFPDFPEGARFFNDNESLFLIKKLQLYGGNSGYGLRGTALTYLKTLIDPLIWMPIIISFFTGYACYGMTMVQPLTTESSGFLGLELARRTVYCWLAAFGWSIINSILSDYMNLRLPFVLVNLLLAAFSTIGFAHKASVALMYHNDKKFALLLVIFSSCFAAMPLIICWSTMNLLGHLRRSLAIALNISATSLGAIASYWNLFKVEGLDLVDPYNGIGFKQSYIFLILAAAFTVFYAVYLFHVNRLKTKNTYIQKWNSQTDNYHIIFGDKNPLFKYQY